VLYCINFHKHQNWLLRHLHTYLRTTKNIQTHHLRCIATKPSYVVAASVVLQGIPWTEPKFEGSALDVGCWLLIWALDAGRLVVEPTLKKDESNWEIFPKIGVNIKNIWNHHLLVIMNWLGYVYKKNPNFGGVLRHSPFWLIKHGSQWSYWLWL